VRLICARLAAASRWASRLRFCRSRFSVPTS